MDEEGQSSRPSSLVTGVRRGILGAVGLPLTGALDLVSGVTSSIAATTGVAPRSAVRHAARIAGALPAVMPSKTPSFTSPSLTSLAQGLLNGLAALPDIKTE